MKLKARLAVLLVSTMVLSSTPALIWASDYENHWAAEAIDRWKDRGIVDGFEDGSFKPNEAITKAQFAKILTEIFGLTETKEAKAYQDVSADKWYSEYISKISDAGIMYEEGEKFNPNAFITREEAAYALANAYKLSPHATQSKVFADEANISSWALEAIAAMYDEGYIRGANEGKFNPKGSLTRAEMITMLDRMNSDVIHTKGTYSKDVNGNLVVNTRDVELKDMTISGNLYLAQGIGDGDITLDNITVKGQVFVEGGGINSIKSNNCTYEKNILVLAKNPVRIVNNGKKISIEALPGTHLILTGKFKEVIVSPGVSLEIKEAEIEKLIVLKEGNNQEKAPNIQISADSKVEKLQADGPALIEGKGKVGELIVNSDNVSIEQKPERLTIQKGIKVKVAGKMKPESSTGNASSNSSNSSNSSSSSSSSNSSSSNSSSGSGGSTTPSTSPSLAPTYKVGGVIYAQPLTGEKVVAKNAEIRIYEVDGGFIKSEFTNEKGEYSFSLPSGKNYGFEITMEDEMHNGYYYNQSIGTLKNDLNQKEIILQQEPVTYITVVGTDGKPMKDVKVVCLQNGEEIGDISTSQTGTVLFYLMGDEESTFSFKYYLGDKEVIPTEVIGAVTNKQVKEDYNYKLEQKIILPYSENINQDGTLTGKVMFNGQPKSNYPIVLERRKTIGEEESEIIEEGCKTVRTDQEGNFTFTDLETNLPEGEYYRLWAGYRDENGDSYCAEYNSLSIAAFKANGNVIELQQTYGVIVKVVDEVGKPVQGAKVVLKGTYNQNDYFYDIETDENGIADIYETYIKPGQNQLTVSYDGNEVSETIQMEEGTYNYEKEIKLEGVKLEGKLATIELTSPTITIGSKTLTAKYVSIEKQGVGEQGGEIDKDGKVSFMLPEGYSGDLYLNVSAEHGENLYSEKINIPEDEEVYNQAIDLNQMPCFTFNGKVLRTTSGNLGAEPEVTTGASLQIKMLTWTEYENTAVAHTTTTDSGYKQEGLPASSAYVIVATYTDERGKNYIGRMFYGERLIIGENAGASLEIPIDDIELGEQTTLEIIFKDENQIPLANLHVRIAGEYAKTDDTGKVTFDAALGSEVACEVWGQESGEYEVIKICNADTGEDVTLNLDDVKGVKVEGAMKLIVTVSQRA